MPMNPLSIWTFYRRHKGHLVLLLSLISLMITGGYLIGALGWGIFVENYRSINMFLSRFSTVGCRFESELDQSVLTRIRANPDVERVIVQSKELDLLIPNLAGDGMSGFDLFALMEQDVPYVLEKSGVTLKEGRLPQPRTNQIALSEQIAVNLGLQVGDVIHNSVDPDTYAEILEPLEVVGILEGDVRLGILSYEYLDSHELYRDSMDRGLLVVPRKGRQAAVESFLQQETEDRQTYVWTFQMLNKYVNGQYRDTFPIAFLVAAATATALTLVVGAVNRLAFARRLSEFGILQAYGHGKAWLMRRLTMETSVLAFAGCLAGIGLSWLILYVLQMTLFAPRGYDLDVISLAPMMLVAPIPLAVVGFTLFSAQRAFSRLDAVAVVERSELILEENRRRAAVSKSAAKPMAPWTFYRRHKRQAILLSSALAVMILMVVPTVLIFAAVYDAEKVKAGNLRHASVVFSRGPSLEPGAIAQIKTHPTVERVIPYVPFTASNVFIPPTGSQSITTYAVSTADLAYLAELYHLELKEGRWPRPNTNDIVIPETVAQNRDLWVGDVLGNPDDPAYRDAPELRAEFVVSGIIARPVNPKEENWLSFASVEFLESHESFANWSRELFVVPKAGQMAAMNDWLGNVENDQTGVFTFHEHIALIQESARSFTLTMTLIESVLAIVGAIGIAMLNYIYASQRQSEFGTLHALGFGRLKLVARMLRETVFVTGIGWAFSAVLCLAGLVYLRFGIFEPMGLRFNLLNVTPWSLTLPIPIAVLIVTGSMVFWMLSRLDPVTVIERRQTE
jgi:ABC-type lipoprotein release transport system permease subunit